MRSRLLRGASAAASSDYTSTAILKATGLLNLFAAIGTPTEGFVEINGRKCSASNKSTWPSWTS